MHLNLQSFRFFREIVFIVLLLVISNNVLYKKNLEKNEVFIHADGRGYYEYLPALFIYNDIHFGYIDTLKTAYYEIEQNKLIYPFQKDGNRINKYYVGTAVLQAPFFFIAHQIASKDESKDPPDGFSEVYQRSIWVAAIFYLFLGLLFNRLLLQTYQVNGFWIFIVQIGIVYATPLLNYTIYDSAYSHVYSFFLISCFSYLVRKYFLELKSRYLVLSLIVLGFIIIVRPINLLVLLFLPLLSDSLKEFSQKFLQLFKQHFRAFIIGMICFFSIISIQLYISYLQTGNAMSYNYGEEGFHFLNPHFTDFLFSYHKGFFLWTPWWFIVFIFSVIYWIIQKKFGYLLCFFTAFLFLSYVLSSWHAWSYGGSIGQRPMIDFYGVFILAFIPILTHKNLIGKIGLLILSPFLVFLMNIQIFQYQKAIIPLDGVTKAWYWKMFLNTDEKYSWYFYRTKLPVGALRYTQKIQENLEFKVPQMFYYVPIFEPREIDSLTKVGEIKFNVDREFDSEYSTIYLLDSTNQVVSQTTHNLFHSQYGNSVICRFPIPEDFKRIAGVQIGLYSIQKPLKIERILFSTYNR